MHVQKFSMEEPTISKDKLNTQINTKILKNVN